MKKQTLNEEVARIKGMMGLSEQHEMPSTDTTPQFKVGDTVSDPGELGTGPEFDGKIIEIYPNMKAAENSAGYESLISWMKVAGKHAERVDVNAPFYLIKWRTEGINLTPTSDMQGIIIAPDGRDYNDFEEDNEDGDELCGCCAGTGEGAGESRCFCCGGTGEAPRRGYDDGPDPDDDYDSREDEDRGYQYGRFYDGN